MDCGLMFELTTLLWTNFKMHMALTMFNSCYLLLSMVNNEWFWTFLPFAPRHCVLDRIILNWLTVNKKTLKLALFVVGHVCVGNLRSYLPFILEEIESNTKRQYLLLHSLKEVRWWFFSFNGVLLGYTVYDLL